MNSSRTKWSAFVVRALVIATMLAGAGGAAPAADQYQLAWSEEFEQDGPPDPRNWTFEQGFVRNEELQWYQPENARCEGGILTIEARREREDNPHHNPDSRRAQRRPSHAAYTSSSLMTRDRHEWLYGRFEMRGRIDTRPGLWPAFWTLGTARDWPGGGEIDVMESYRGLLLANAAWLGDNGQAAWDSVRRPLTSFQDQEWSDKFHIWRMDWNRESIRLYVDDILLNEIDVAEAVNHDADRKHPFREPHYILLNLAVGGTNGGDPSATQFPARFEVDYVRVYQQRNEVNVAE